MKFGDLRFGEMGLNPVYASKKVQSDADRVAVL